jgi:ATP-binding cassette subfamily F protein uup
LVEVKGVTKSYTSAGVTQTLFKNLDLKIGPKDRIGLLGHNGCGKSTLIKILLGEELPTTGISVRADNLKPLYFEQSRESLDPKLSVLKTICPLGEHLEYRNQKIHVRSYLDRFLFFGPQVDLPVAKLSGGEQARLLLARLMLKEANLLVLDEPTNDLDLATLSVLEDCLRDFEGGIILVTHDRYFMEQISTQIIAFPPPFAPASAKGTLERFASLEQWEAWHEELKLQGPGEPEAHVVAAPVAKQKLGYKEQRELDQMEGAMQKAESALAGLQKELSLPENMSNSKTLRELSQKIELAQKEVDRLFSRWGELEAKGAK